MTDIFCMRKVNRMRDQLSGQACLNRLIKNAFDQEMYQRFIIFMMLYPEVQIGLPLLKAFVAKHIEINEDEKTIEKFKDLIKYLENK